MKRLADTDFDKPWLLLCEGEADRVFLNLVIKSASLPDNFIVKFPSRDSQGRGGRSKFGPYIENLIDTSVSFRSIIKAILIMTDSDGQPADAFNEVLSSLRKSNKIALPKALDQWGKLAGQADVYISTIPKGSPGGLETLCLEAAYNKWPGMKKAVEDFSNATGADKWSVAKLEKMKIHSIIASTCASNPEAGLSHHWKEDSQYHIPISDSVFDEVRKTLQSFSSSAPT